MSDAAAAPLLPRVLEPEVMDDWQEAVAYDAMDFGAVDRDFALTAIGLAPSALQVLDIGTGTAKIPIILCQQQPRYRVQAIDLAASMLTIGHQNVIAAGLEQQIQLTLADGKRLPYAAGSFDLVISNSLAHHIPEPIDLFQEVARLVSPQGAVLIRDLLRPTSGQGIDRIVTAAGNYDERQTQLFRDSLHAALTLPEVQALVDQAGLSRASVYQSSDRHWTVAVAASSSSHINMDN